MKYKFYEKADIICYDFSIPWLKILDKEYKDSYLDHLWSLSWQYIREIVTKMEEVRDGKLDTYNFWPQDSVYIVLNWPTFKNEEYRNKTFIFKSFSDYEKEIPFEEIYWLMKDYMIEIEKWEKRTGMSKPGW